MTFSRSGFAGRIFVFIAVFALVLAQISPVEAARSKSKKAAAKTNDRYAAFVINSDTGQVLHSENADAYRYPASLTKMMTLYMLFEALESGKLTMNSMLSVSAKAASMPQTNLSLRKGDYIAVKDAIPALVIRSANDVAVVVAEALGKTEWNFGVMMTSKARSLGMRNTVFRNASGLPDSKQLTTARDMATLGIALRRNYPKYYHHFNTRSFSFKGRTYTTHNRVLNRLEGADGIKTGFINASGFNLVTSAKKDGYNLVGVVLGGRTGASRDTQMVSLMNEQFTRLARGGAPRTVDVASAPVAPALYAAAEPATVIPAPRSNPFRSYDTASVSPSIMHDGTIPAPSPKPADYTSKISFSSNGTAASKGWGIQVGAFGDQKQALIAATHAITVAEGELASSRIAVTESTELNSGIHRARLADLSEDQAKGACRKLLARNESCFVFRASSQPNL